MSVETSIKSKPAILSESLRERILAYVPRYPSKRAVVLPALHLVQELFRCVPYKAMEEIAQLLDVAPAEVHDTMSFYGFFTQAPTGEKRVWMCRSISCMLRGGDELIDHACSKLGIEPGGAAADGSITIVPAECLGICDYAPAALCDDGRIFGPLDLAATDAMLAEIRGGKAT